MKGQKLKLSEPAQDPSKGLSAASIPQELSGVVELPAQVQQRIEGLQELLHYQGSKEYGRKKQEVSQRLGMSVRGLQRMMKAWREQGKVGLSRLARADRGEARISQDWQKFIVKTYREGNRGSRQMTPAQVAVRVKVAAQEQGIAEYPSHMTVYRLLKPQIDKGRQQKRSLGWRGGRLVIKSRDGDDIGVDHSNQAWQIDHTLADVLVVDTAGEVLGRPWLTVVVDSYSRCIMGIHLGFDAPSAAVVCLALRHAILPKAYASAYELKQSWGTYGLPEYLYTDCGKDFRSQHLEQVATELGIVLRKRRHPSDGGIIERPFGSLNSQFFASLPGYVSNSPKTRSPQAATDACLTLIQLERLLVRHIVDYYNPSIDARMGDQSRIGRWEAGCAVQLPLLSERELDICLMRRDQRRVYRHGYIQFANLTYQGEHLAAYAGETVIIRYNPRDITTVLIYHLQDRKEVFLTRAHAQGWETEILSHADAQALSRRRRKAGQSISNQSLLSEVRDRDQTVKKLRQKQKKRDASLVPPPTIVAPEPMPSLALEPSIMTAPAVAPESPPEPVPYVPVYDLDELERKVGRW